MPLDSLGSGYVEFSPFGVNIIFARTMRSLSNPKDFNLLEISNDIRVKIGNEILKFLKDNNRYNDDIIEKILYGSSIDGGVHVLQNSSSSNP